MKRLILLLLTLLLLCGCARQTPEQEQIVTTAATEQPTETTVPVQEAEPVPLQTWPLEIDYCTGIAPMGDALLVFTQEETTRVQTLSGTCQLELPDSVTPADGFVQVSQDGICFFSQSAHAVFRYSAELQQTARIELPEEITAPLLDEACTTLYYASGSAVYAYSLNEGISRLIGDFHCETVVLEKLLCGDTALQCFLIGGESEQGSLYISTETGELLSRDAQVCNVQTCGETYLAEVLDGSRTIYVTGEGTSEVRELLPVQEYPQLTLLDAAHVLSSVSGETGTVLEVYDLQTGRRTAQLQLEGTGAAWGFCTDDSGKIWFLLQAEQQTVCCWDPAQSPIEDETCYLSGHYTADAPDEAGLAQCRATAQQLGDRYGVSIYLWPEDAAPVPEDYSFTAEYQVPTLQRMLEQLEAALSGFPEGFFAQAAQYSDSGRLQITLVRSLEGIGADTLTTATGIQYWQGAEACIALADDLQLEQYFYHELFHIIDNRVLGTSTAFDDWDSLNPDGFAYDNSYVENLDRSGDAYLDGSLRAFIDTYSMSYPGEDRARIFEYAMIPEGEELFTCEILQAKLACICQGIREAFGLTDYSGALPWEQYLN